MERINRLKKGCEKNFFVTIDGSVLEFECGKWKEVSKSPLFHKMLWCPLCAEKIIEEQDKLIKSIKLTGEKE